MPVGHPVKCGVQKRETKQNNVYTVSRISLRFSKQKKKISQVDLNPGLRDARCVI